MNLVGMVGPVGLVGLVVLVGLVGLLANSGYFLAIQTDANYFQMEILSLLFQKNFMIPKSLMV